MNTREVAKREWDAATPPTFDAISAGALQRIADATETMAKRYQELIDERDRYKEMYHRALSRRIGRDRQIAALRGVITKLKKKLEGAA